MGHVGQTVTLGWDGAWGPDGRNERTEGRLRAVRQRAGLGKDKWLLKDTEVWVKVARSVGTWRDVLCSVWVGTGGKRREQAVEPACGYRSR